MRKILGIFFFLFAFIFIGNSQLAVKYSNDSVNQNDTANINVTVDNFVKYFGMQLSVNWDSTKFKFGRIANINSTYGSNFSFATPGPGNPTLQGTIGFIFEAFSQPTIPNNTILFTIKLKAVGAECDSTTIFTSDIPTESEYYDENFTTIPINNSNTVNGKAKINGVNCTVINPPNDTAVIVTAATLIVAPGAEVCVPIRVKNFTDIEAAQSKIVWDENILQYKEIRNKTESFSQNDANKDIGEFTFVWLPPGDNLSLTLAENATFFEICFTAIGPEGSMSVIDLIDMDENIETIFTKNSVEHPFVNNDGKVTISSNPPAVLKITVADVTVNEDEFIDVSFKVDNFIEITGFQFAPTWNSNIATFENRNADGINNLDGNFIPSNRYNAQWGPSAPVTLANGTVLFNLRFKGVGCDQTTEIIIQDLQDFDIQFINNNAQEVPYIIEAGSIFVNCGTVVTPTCNIVSSTNVTCNGASTGSITAQVTDADAGCQCIWKKDGVQFGNALPVSNCNLINIPAGVYVLEVVCDGTVETTCNVTITEPSAIVIAPSVTNVGCADKGSITLTVTGGTPNYTYLWDGTITTKDIAGLNAGTYTVVVTDANGCTKSTSAVVTTVTPTPLVVTSTKEDVKCFGTSTGSAALTISGGCTSYTVKWSDDSTITSATRTNLASGNYSYTVTDGSTPANTTSNVIVINQPALDLTITDDSVTNANNGNNGSINITATGGTGNISYSWTGSITALTDDIANLGAGTYNLLVTDANGCTKSKSYTIIDEGTVGDDLTFSINVPTENVNAGYGVSCVNLCDAIIAGVVDNKGTAPYTLTLTGPATTRTLTLTQAGSYQFIDLCVGTYTVRVSDSTGKSATKTDEITQPTIIRVTSDVDCSDGILSNGAIDLTVTGGAGDYTFAWGHGDDEEDIRNLAVGRYNVVVEDANGCQQLLQNINVKDCNEPEECYEGIPIITPNNDGINDYFIISCAIDIDNELFIYDRWGKLIFSRKNYDNTWNGESLSGDVLKENGYMWVFNYENNDGSRESIKGTVTLLRD